MKIYKLGLVLVMFCTGNYIYTQETSNSAENTGSSSTLNGPVYIEDEGVYTYGSQVKTLYKVIDSVPLKPLFEMFTSSTCEPCVEANEILDELFENNPNEYASIKYQMNWPGSGDPYYTEEGGVRSNYYNVNSIPDLFINAEQLQPASSITQEIFDEYTGLMTYMEIEITNASINEDKVITVEAYLTSLANYEAGMTAHMVVIEKKTINNVGTNGETEFHDVMMKMLPDASGTELEVLGIGSQVVLSETYDMDETNMETPNDLAVVVFVQDDSDKSVIQSAMADVDGSWYGYNITYIIKDLNANPIEGAQVDLENYGILTSDEYGQVIFQQTLPGTYAYSVNYAGLIPYSNTINIIDEDITLEIILEHYTSLQETFNSGLPLSWTKHVAEGSFLFPFSGTVKFFMANGGVGPVMLISPAIEINSTDTLTFEYGDILNEPTLLFGTISDPYDPETFTNIEILYPEDEWQTYELDLSSLTSSDTVIYFAWQITCEIESEFHLDNVFVKKEGEICLPIYTSGCSNSGTGFTDFALEQIENYGSYCADLSGTGWSRYLEMDPAELMAGETYTITMATGSDNVNASIWIDFNDDFSFTADEMVIDNFVMENQANLYDVELTIPANVADGLYLLRARTNGYGLCIDPCEEYYYGEAEDYLVQIGEEQIIPPTNLNYEVSGSDVVLVWDAPASDELTGYNVYHAHESGAFEVLANVIETTFTHETPEYGLHQYYVTAVYDAGESDPTNPVEVLITGVQRQLENSFHLYPNPASDVVNIKSDFDIICLSLYNYSGKIVANKMVKDKIFKFDTSPFDSGLYLFQIVTTQGIINKRIIFE